MVGNVAKTQIDGRVCVFGHSIHRRAFPARIPQIAAARTGLATFPTLCPVNVLSGTRCSGEATPESLNIYIYFSDLDGSGGRI